MAQTVNIRESKINQHIILRIQNVRAICGGEPLTDSLDEADDCCLAYLVSIAMPAGSLVLWLYIDVRASTEWLAVTDVYNYRQCFQYFWKASLC